jgi:two-component system, sensor histidine kinase LadS
VTGHLDKAASRYGLDAGKPSTGNFAEMSLNDILSGIHEMFLPDARAKGLRFDYVPTSTGIAVEPLAVMRIVTNLVSNAIKYTNEGRILLGVRSRANGIGIEVHDTGPGLDEDAFREACRHSARLAADSDQGGHGFGLAIVTELAARHGYEVAILERSGGGTSICLLIPDAGEAIPSPGLQTTASPGIPRPAP